MFNLIIFIFLLLIIFFFIIFPIKKENWSNKSNKKSWCLNCMPIQPKKKDTQYFTTNNNLIPDWLKKESIYTNLPKPLIMSHKYNPLKNPDFKIEYSCGKKCKKIEFDLHKFKDIPNKKFLWIFYWSTRKRDYKKFILPDPKTAFGDYENYGLVRSNEDGIVKFKINTPQPYQDNGKMFPPHLQFCYKQLDNLWSEKIYTIFFFPELSFSKFKKIRNKHSAIIINALPKDKGTIENTLRVPYDNPTSISLSQEIKNIIKTYHYRSLKRLVDDKRLSIKHIPIIIYCKNRECEAGTILFNHLLNKGYYNLLKYPGGLEEWTTKNKK